MKSFTIIAAAALAASVALPVTAAGQEGPGVGARVMSSDGASLGRLEGRRNSEGRMEIVVRGEDGRMRAIPADAVTPHGDMLHANWTSAQFNAAEAIALPPGPGSAGAGGGNQGMSPNQNTAPPAGQPSASGAVEDATRPATPEQNQAPPPQF